MAFLVPPLGMGVVLFVLALAGIVLFVAVLVMAPVDHLG
jgi:hypothetical protein